MEKVKVINKKTGVVKEVKKTLAGDYIGTGDFEMYKEAIKPRYNVNRDERLNDKY